MEREGRGREGGREIERERKRKRVQFVVVNNICTAYFISLIVVRNEMPNFSLLNFISISMY